MALAEIVRFQDVYEADLAAAFLADRGIDVDVTERFQTTVDPLMQRALGLRLMAPSDQVEAARDLWPERREVNSPMTRMTTTCLPPTRPPAPSDGDWP